MSTATLPVPLAVAPARNKRRTPVSLPDQPAGHWRPRPRTATAKRIDQPDALLVRLADLTPDDPRRVAVRTQAIEWYLPMAAHLARKFTGRGEPVTDLTQVAVIGLIKAVDRYDAHRGSEFASYAIPTILGEIKRHFRDTTWHIRVPRAVQELKLKLPPAVEDLTQLLHRPPTTAELAARLDVTPGEVVDARRSGYAYRPLSLEQPAPVGEDRRDRGLLGTVGAVDGGIDAVDHRETVRRRLAELPDRERRIIALRYLAELTQAEIATRTGLSQMHVSRLLAASLTRLRTGTRAAELSARG